MTASTNPVETSKAKAWGLGQPWQPGQTWFCPRCGQGGDDRDDVAFKYCTAGPLEPRRQPHGALVFTPAAHHAKIAARSYNGLRYREHEISKLCLLVGRVALDARRAA